MSREFSAGLVALALASCVNGRAPGTGVRSPQHAQGEQAGGQQQERTEPGSNDGASEERSGKGAKDGEAEPLESPQNLRLEDPRHAQAPPREEIDAVLKRLSQLAARAAPGAKPFAQPMVANLQGTDPVDASFELDFGKCYTVVAAGQTPSVDDVDLEMFAIGANGKSVLIASDGTRAPETAIRSAPDCFQPTRGADLRVRIVMRVAAGAGIAAAQIYSK
jgi:hypothetical protein